MDNYDANYLNPKRQQQRQLAEQDFAKASQANQSATEHYLEQMGQSFDRVAAELRRGTEQQLKQLPQDYQYAYDKNAIQQLANERQLSERMSQLGMTDSGLNRTQQTAINLQRSNADQAVTQQKNAQINALRSALAEKLAQNQQSRLNTEAQARYDLANRNQDLYAALMQNADSLAASLASNQYSADQQLAASKYQADQQRAAAVAEAAAKQYELNLKYGTSGMSYSDASKLAMQLAQADVEHTDYDGSTYDAYLGYMQKLMGGNGEAAFKPTSAGYEAARSNALARYGLNQAFPNAPKNEHALDLAISNFLQKGVITEAEAAQIYKDAGVYRG